MQLTDRGRADCDSRSTEALPTHGGGVGRMGTSLVPCVVYAAKSTEDRGGSIPDQLHECRSAIECEPGRSVLAEYSDEAASAFTRSRGPGLDDAMRHAEELAKDGCVAELWALHSDRLARGDGRAARHAVEIALWALKHDVAVKTVQDPDTFRDLLYAVVTGQRNNEDSRRKGLASAAGRPRRGARRVHGRQAGRLHARGRGRRRRAYRGNGVRRCPAPRIDADILEAMFASASHSLLLEGEQPEQTMRPHALAPREGSWSDSPERERVLDAVVAGDDAALDAVLEALLGTGGARGDGAAADGHV
jgi:resolvase-like protein